MKIVNIYVLIIKTIGTSCALSCLLFLSFTFQSTQAALGSAGLAPLLFNAANGQSSSASSYYHDPLGNPLLRYKYVPDNAIDGLVLTTSWWSSGEPGEKVYWQLDFSEPPRTIEKIIVRWHGYQSAKSYRVRVSFMGDKFATIFYATNMSMTWDRNDEFIDPDQRRFQFLRIEMDEINTCDNQSSCGRRRLEEGIDPKREVYGIREVEVWSTGQFGASSSIFDLIDISLGLSLSVSLTLYMLKFSE